MVGETKVTLVAVGLLVVSNPDVVVDALVVNLAASPAFHVNVLPLAIVAIKTCPKLLKDHKPGSRAFAFSPPDVDESGPAS